MWSRFEADAEARFILTDLVLAEVVSFIQRRSPLPRAEARDAATLEASRILGSWRATVVVPTLEEIVAAVEEQRDFADPTVGFVDCVSFAVMRRVRARTAFTFDRQRFAAAGFTVVP